MSSYRTIATVIALAAVLAVGSVGASAIRASATDRQIDPAQPASFTIVVASTADGIDATCERGCAWAGVTAHYPLGRYELSEAGVKPIDAAAADPAGGTFSLRLFVTERGRAIQAICEHGCTWTSLSGSYPNNEYRITEKGIGPAGDPSP